MRVVLGVSAGIAAYKSAILLRLFTESGHDVTVVPTQAALHFVGEATWAALSGKPVRTTVWQDVDQVPHVRVGQQADLVVVAPATADLIARAAVGLADDLLTTTLLTTTAPVLIAPAMHTEMWQHRATQANVATLRSRGVHVLDPADGRLTGKDSGPGRMPEPDELYAAALALVEDARPSVTASAGRGGADLTGRTVVITAGGTREPLDPVRFLGNRSSGKQGYALAARAAARGAHVQLISANVWLPDPVGVQVATVETAQEMEAAVAMAYDEADAIVMAAAVADFRPRRYVSAKIKKSHDAGDDEAPQLELVRNPDILAGLVERRRADRGKRPLLVGFAAETGDQYGTVLEHARAKLMRKGCDLIVANEVGVDTTFGKDDTTVHILHRDGRDVVTVGPTSKLVVSDMVWDVVSEYLNHV